MDRRVNDNEEGKTFSSPSLPLFFSFGWLFECECVSISSCVGVKNDSKDYIQLQFDYFKELNG